MPTIPWLPPDPPPDDFRWNRGVPRIEFRIVFDILERHGPGVVPAALAKAIEPVEMFIDLLAAEAREFEEDATEAAETGGSGGGGGGGTALIGLTGDGFHLALAVRGEGAGCAPTAVSSGAGMAAVLSPDSALTPL